MTSNSGPQFRVQGAPPKLFQDARGTQRDRLTFTLFLALCFHLIIILGVGFDSLVHSSNHRIINVVLAHNISDKAPKKAEFIGQDNQLGGGDAMRAQAAQSPVQAPFPSQHIAPPPSAGQRATPPSKTHPRQRLLTSLMSEQKTPQSHRQRQPEHAGQQPTQNQQSTRSMEIASLQAELDQMRRAHSRAPKRRVISPSIHRASDALYLDAWQRKVENIGNLNYPTASKHKKIYGQLTLKVGIRIDGTIEKIEILKSSGNAVLDDAARRIIHLASPFAPLPPQIRRETDVLEIIRIWRFAPGNRLSTRG